MSARILVVDDNPINVKLLEAKLSAEYFEVLVANDGPSALDVTTAQLPDLILLDVMMPGMDGFEVCRRLKDDHNTAHIPVVMVTALSDVSDRVRGLEAGADDFLTKPVNDIALFARVRSLVRLKMMTDELRARQATSDTMGLLQTGVNGSTDLDRQGKILIAEGSALIGKRLVSHLEEEGHEVDLVGSGSEALEKSIGGQYDLIIVDLVIRGEDSLRLCSQFRSQDQTRHTPILALLDDMDMPKLAKGLELGITDYLIKPIDRNELRARSRTQIRRRRYHDLLCNMLDKSVSMAYTDELTGVYNRRYMSGDLERKIAAIDETGKPLSVIAFDIDHFKKVNDTYGHPIGDEVLKGVARYTLEELRNFDLVARVGGEEFVVIMVDVTHEMALCIADRLRVIISEETFARSRDGEPISVTVSMGVATALTSAESPTDLLTRADDALYVAKRDGRNMVASADMPTIDLSSLPAVGGFS